MRRKKFKAIFKDTNKAAEAKPTTRKKNELRMWSKKRTTGEKSRDTQIPIEITSIYFSIFDGQ